MRVLIVKTSSLGDVLHTLPAVTEAAAAHAGMRFDWVVEPAFAAVPRWHPAVERVIEAPLRGLRRGPLGDVPAGLAALDAELREGAYDAVIDAQGLLKSAVLARRGRGRHFGLDPASIRERPASLAYERWVRVPRAMHAVERTRHLFAASLGHALPGRARDHGLGARVRDARADAEPGNEVMLLPGTTWRSKHWPEAHWCELAGRLAADGLEVRVAFAGAAERARAERIAAAGSGELLPEGGLDALFTALARARAVVGVDSGPLHLAAAIGVAGVALYGPTDPALTGPWSDAMEALAPELGCAPCRARRCGSPLPPIGGRAALEPPCLGRIAPRRVHRRLLARIGVA